MTTPTPAELIRAADGKGTVPAIHECVHSVVGESLGDSDRLPVPKSCGRATLPALPISPWAARLSMDDSVDSIPLPPRAATIARSISTTELVIGATVNPAAPEAQKPAIDRGSKETIWRELRGVVERITVHNPETGFTVARLAPERRHRTAAASADGLWCESTDPATRLTLIHQEGRTRLCPRLLTDERG